MVNYRLLGFNSFDDYLDEFFRTLLPTNRTYNYFVDWSKVKENVRKHIYEINILNALTKVKGNERLQLLKEILIKYPETLSLIPLILAIREKSIEVLEIANCLKFHKFNFETRVLSADEINEILDFCDKTGILDLFDEINDLYAYMIGVEVGEDTNARKNRSGEIFQGLVEQLINRTISCEDLRDIILKSEVELSSLGIKVSKDTRPKREKKADFVIYHGEKPKIVIECNFYSVPGSKPIEVSRAYTFLSNRLKEKNITFIWITDGPAWRNMKNAIISSATEIDYLLNYLMAEKHLKKILCNICTPK